LKQRTVCAGVSGVVSPSIGANISQSDTYISYLPLAHILERVIQQSFFNVGGTCGFFAGDVQKLVDDIGGEMIFASFFIFFYL